MSEDIQPKLGRAIASRRAELGLSRTDLSEGAGVSYTFLTEIEKGMKAPSARSLGSLADALGMRPHELLERADAVPPGPGEPALAMAVPASAPAPSAPESRWFHGDAIAPKRRSRGRTAEPDLAGRLEQIVREIVRDELRRAGVEPG